MTGFEYKVVPAPLRGVKAKGVKGTPARFALALQTVMNDMGAQGWDYQRTDTLPVEERQGLTGKTTTFQNMLVFRRVLTDETVDAPDVAALIEDKTTDEAPITEPVTDVESDVTSEDDAPDAVAPDDVQQAQSTPADAKESTPFTFPWNNRGGPAKRPKDDEGQTTAAE